MNYAVLDDMIDRYGRQELIELTAPDDEMPPETMNEARITRMLDDAQAFIDGYVGQIYRLPLRGCVKPIGIDQVEYVAPPQLTRLACDLARYYLYDDLAPEGEVYRRFKGARQELEQIAAGSTQLACSWGGEPGELIATTAQSGGGVEYSFSPRAITDQTLEGF